MRAWMLAIAVGLGALACSRGEDLPAAAPPPLSGPIALDSTGLVIMPSVALEAAEPPLTVRLELPSGVTCEAAGLVRESTGVVMPPITGTLITPSGERLALRAWFGSSPCTSIALSTEPPREAGRRVSRIELAAAVPLQIERIDWNHGPMRMRIIAR
jgi:hypothetical protein